VRDPADAMGGEELETCGEIEFPQVAGEPPLVETRRNSSIRVSFAFGATDGAGRGLEGEEGPMFITGVGIGMVMQVQVLATQNAVDLSDLGVATSGATFLRSPGDAMGLNSPGDRSRGCQIYGSMVPGLTRRTLAWPGSRDHGGHE
jgi:hypothetical protein